jgi:hypothetical protein
MTLEQRLTATYAAFNARDIDQVLAQMTEDVDWPNAWEGGRVVGHDAVRDYWTRQWAEIDPEVQPSSFRRLRDGRIEVTVHQVVRGPDGSVLSDGMVLHTYAFRGEQIARMDVSEAPRRLSATEGEGSGPPVGRNHAAVGASSSGITQAAAVAVAPARPLLRRLLPT